MGVLQFYQWFTVYIYEINTVHKKVAKVGKAKHAQCKSLSIIKKEGTPSMIFLKS